MEASNLNALIEFINRIPSVEESIASGVYANGNWWIKFSLDINNKLAWNVIQEFGHLFNYLSLDERLPTLFYPVSAPPYLNGGPKHYLHWIVESTDTSFSPQTAAEWLEGRLPNPVDDIAEWDNP
jgi:hypothetical protein